MFMNRRYITKYSSCFAAKKYSFATNWLLVKKAITILYKNIKNGIAMIISVDFILIFLNIKKFQVNNNNIIISDKNIMSLPVMKTGIHKKPINNI